MQKCYRTFFVNILEYDLDLLIQLLKEVHHQIENKNVEIIDVLYLNIHLNFFVFFLLEIKWILIHHIDQDVYNNL